MSEYLFGVRYGKLDKAERTRRKKAAAKHNATFVYANMPDGTRSWFSADNLGEPFDIAGSA